MALITQAVLLAIALSGTGQINAKSINGISENKKNDANNGLVKQRNILEDQQPRLEYKLTVEDQSLGLRENLHELEDELDFLEDNLPVLQETRPEIIDKLAVLINQANNLAVEPSALETQINIDMTNGIKSETSQTGDGFEINDDDCTYPFEKVGKNCYMFSDAELSYDNAKAYCENLSHGHTYEISLGMLGYSEMEDQEILNAVANKGHTYWVGAHGVYSEESVSYRWLDNRTVNLNAQFWAVYDLQIANCIAAESQHFSNNNSRSYLHTRFCSASNNFICQVGCPEAFLRIGNHCYMRSWYSGVPNLSWSEARQYCSSLVMPVGYHADLAVFGLQDQNVYDLMITLADNEMDQPIWIGASHDEACKYTWIDGRELSVQSMYWYDYGPDYPHCDDNMEYEMLFDYRDLSNRPFIADYDEGNLPFICQVFRDTN